MLVITVTVPFLNFIYTLQPFSNIHIQISQRLLNKNNGPFVVMLKKTLMIHILDHSISVIFLAMS